MLDDQLNKLLEFAKETDLQEVLWEKDGTQVAFRRGRPARPAKKPLPEAQAEASAEAKPREPVYIRSTMVGTFYRAESLQRPPLVVDGTVVASEQPVAAIEAMKIMKDVLAPMPCRILKALVVNGHAVEYGQPLFEVEPVVADV